jgi:uncharacterized protein (TIGR03435 family)
MGAPAPAPAPQDPRFEVASVKPSPTTPIELGRAAAAGGGRVSMPAFGVRTQPGRLTASMSTVQSLILRAYGLRPYQLEGGPGWLTTDYFDIAAKAESDDATEAEMNQMLKSLLADRFGLRVHVETRDAPVHTLTVARADGKLGPALKKTSPACEATLEERKRTKDTSRPPLPSGPAAMATPVCGMSMMMMNARSAATTFTMGGVAFTSLVERVSGELNGPVIDRTGLTGLFDAVLEYETSRRPAIPGVPSPGLDPNSTDPLPVPLPEALEQQLGLKLEKTVGPIPVTIVDAAEHPSAD